MAETLPGGLYDYPRYYDLVFGSDWRAEYRWLLASFQRHASGPVQRVFEPACGTGRLLYRLAKAGFEVSGLDLNRAAVDYCNQRLQRHGFAPTAVVGDMADFRVPCPVDAGFNMINSFRHLTDGSAALNHLRCMARILRPGGLYLLGLHLHPTKGKPLESESWSARRGNLAVTTRLWLVAREPSRRRERYRMSYAIYTPTRFYRLVDDVEFRTYTARQFRDLLRRVPEFELAATYDFAYDIDRPIRVTAETEDVVYVLRKR